MGYMFFKCQEKIIFLYLINDKRKFEFLMKIELKKKRVLKILK